MIRRIFCIMLFCISLPAAAWDNRGHRVIGELAYDRLQAIDPAAVQTVVAVMTRHPDKARFDHSLAGLSGETRSRRMFGLMARWPDDIRKTAWDHPDWHYALKVVNGWTRLDWYTAGAAEDQWAANLATARDVRALPQDRAVALCWLLHIGGDLHQPLHRGHRLDGNWLKTDRAGTIAYVRRAPGQKTMDLHQLWDGVFDPTGTGGGDEDGDVERLRIAFTPRANAIGSARSFHDWIGESETLARNLAYTGPALLATHTAVDAPPMTIAYISMLRRTAERRVIEAGARIGETIRGLR